APPVGAEVATVVLRPYFAIYYYWLALSGIPPRMKYAMPPSMMGHIESLALQLSSHLIVVDDFLPRSIAASMRRAIDDHFATPDRHNPQTHQLWNYWYVPGLYTYLRTQPEKIISRELVQMLMMTLENWARANLGMDRLTWPYLSMYINGCRQG